MSSGIIEAIIKLKHELEKFGCRNVELHFDNSMIQKLTSHLNLYIQGDGPEGVKVLSIVGIPIKQIEIKALDPIASPLPQD